MRRPYLLEWGAAGGLLLVGVCALAIADDRSQERERAVAARQVARADARMGMEVTLVQPEKNSARGAATVQVKVTGVKMVDPAEANEEPRDGQGHLHYRVDNGPVVATTSTKLSFHELPVGEHKIMVMLAGNDHQPLGPRETLSVRIVRGPAEARERSRTKVQVGPLRVDVE